jgi:hypothetical protein
LCYRLQLDDTLAKILDTTFEVASKRIVEEVAYRGFKELLLTERGGEAEALLKEIQ